jgi:hypothetical protein
VVEEGEKGERTEGEGERERRERERERGERDKGGGPRRDRFSLRSILGFD